MNWSTAAAYKTFFIKQELGKGIFKATIEANGNFDGGFMFGVVHKSLLNSFFNTYLCSVAINTCSLFHNCIYCGNWGAQTGTFFPSSGEVTLSLELDGNKHILFFFVNKKQLPHSVTNVPPLVYFGVSGYQQFLNIKLKSVVRLASPSIKRSLSCSKIAWR